LKRADGELVEATIQQPAERRLAPDATVNVGFTTAQPVPGTGPIQPVLDLAGVKIEPTLEAILGLVLDSRVVEFVRNIEVIASFADPKDGVTVVAFVGPNATSVELTPAANRKTVKLGRSFGERLLGLQQPAQDFEYAYVVVRGSTADKPVTGSAPAKMPILAIDVPAATPGTPP
jgi:hypothetical protein